MRATFFPRFVLSGFLGFASVPGSDEEVRAFLQRRIATNLGTAASLWLGTWVLGTVLMTLSHRPEEQPLQGWITLLHASTGVGLAILWALMRRGSRRLDLLHITDAGGTNVQAVVLGAILAMSSAQFMPQYGLLLGLTYVLLARAAIVPSAPARSAMLATVACVPILVGTWVVHSRVPRPEGYPPAAVMVLDIAVWCGATVLLTVIVSHVIYGLQKKMREVQQLGQYTLEDKIGEGAMGIVYRARHALLRRPTAIKLLRPGNAGDAALARFEREVQLTSRLTHPNTVAIYDYGRTPDGVFYYAMEYLDGIDLETIVTQDGPLPPGRALHLLRQAAGALAEAHHEGLIHRDVKPANLLACVYGLEADFLKVVDFGLVRDTHNSDPALSNVNTLAGTPMYMSPEQIKSPEIDARSDLYALGAVAYFLLTGMTVFPGPTLVEVCSQHLYQVPTRPSERLGRALPRSLEDLVMACLEKEPARRPADARALARALAACADVPAWTADDARRWWDERAAAIRGAAADAPSSGPKGTLIVDFDQRAA